MNVNNTVNRMSETSTGNASFPCAHRLLPAPLATAGLEEYPLLLSLTLRSLSLLPFVTATAITCHWTTRMLVQRFPPSTIHHGSL